MYISNLTCYHEDLSFSIECTYFLRVLPIHAIGFFDKMGGECGGCGGCGIHFVTAVGSSS
jgi:hypothetical protein